MKPLDFLTGPAGLLYSSSCISIIVLLMFIMSARLFLRRRKKAYLSLTLSLVITLVSQLLIVLDSLHNGEWLNAAHLGHLLQIVAFIALHAAIYQLYNKTGGREFVLVTFFIGTAAVISFLHYRFNTPMFTPGSPVYSPLYAVHNIWLELYLFLLVFICFYTVSPYIGQSVKYQAGLTVFFFLQTAHLANVYLFDHQQPGLTIVENFLPLLYYGIVFFILFDRVVELLQAVYRSSITDGLTGLFNRKFFFNRVRQYVSAEHRVSVIFGDIDNFKTLNDTQGHHKADGVLKQVAEIMAEETQGIGLVGRYGGEELVALITAPGVKPDEVAEAIRGRVESESIVTISLGCSKYKKGLTAEELIQLADQAMYMSKTTGKNKVTLHSGR
ncbi:sensor domain-containing diguanylate cyclase [Paenibacillus gansuensis]|uniref:GGDEF domain-containing protein n=1 Tax=Paenibacillus gansuensis TaxID=306542 RepID=A0ABW5PEE5_9BACL